MNDRRHARGTWGLLIVVVSGCGGTTDMDVAGEPVTRPIVNGTRQPQVVSLSARQVLAVGALVWDDGTNFCTGTLIAPSVVLTAAHCVHSDSGRTAAASSLAFATGADAAEPRELLAVARVNVHPGYDPSEGTAENDIAVLELAQASTVAEPLPFNCTALDRASLVGQRVQDVGYGDTSSEGSANSRRLWVAEEVVGLGRFDFTVDGHGDGGVCFGDSGGPALWTMGGRATVIGTLSWGDPECGNQDHLARTDFHCPFIRPFVPGTDPAAGSRAVEGVTFTGAEVTATLHLANTATLAALDVDVGLDSRAARGIVDARPLATLEALAAVPYVGATALAALREASR